MRVLALCGCVFFILCLGLAAKANEDDHWLQLPGATLLIGPGTADFLVASRPDQIRQVLPTADQPRVGGYPTPVFPSISRDGRIIACVRWLSLNPQLADVATYSVAEAKWTEYAKGESIRAVSIALDGSKLAFIGNGDQRTPIRLHVIDLKTGADSTFPVGESAWDLSWAPDGEHIVYEQTAQPAVYVLELTTMKTSKIADGRQPAWSPSGEWISYFDSSGEQCWVVRPDGKDRRSLWNLNDSRFFLRPVWSPDSTKLLVNKLRNLDRLAVDIYQFDLSTGKSTRKLKNGVPVLGWAELGSRH